MLVLALVFMSGGLLPGRVAAPMEQLIPFAPWQANYPHVHPMLRGGDYILQQLPWHQWIQNEFQAGRFPLWVSGPLGGYNLFASYQPGVLYPLHLLWALLPTGIGYGIIMALKLWLAGMGMWFFLEALGLRASASLLGALGFMFSAGMVVWLPWAHSGVYLMLPWLAWAVYAWCEQKSRGALVALAALTACAIFGGHPETLFLVGVSTGVWGLALIGTKRRNRFRQVAGLAVSVAVGVLIGAVQLLPFIEALGLSHESALRQAAGGLAPIHLDAGSILDWVLPRTWGQIVDGVMGGANLFTVANPYVGLPALAGVVFAVVAAVRRQLSLRLTLPWVVLAAFGWLVAYDSTIGQAIRSLPIFNSSANQYWLLVVEFCVLVVGAFGWDWLARLVEGRISFKGWRSLGRNGILGVTLLAFGVAIAAAHLAGLIPYPDLGKRPDVLVPPTDAYDLYWAVWAGGIVLAIAGATLLWASGWRGRSAMPLVIAALLVADLWMLLIAYNVTSPTTYYYPSTSFINQLSVVPPTERIVMAGEGPPANTGLIYGFRDWRAQDPMISERAHQAAYFIDPNFSDNIWTDYNMFFSNPRLEVASALGMRYVIMPKGYNPSDSVKDVPDHPDFTRLAYKDGLGLWETQGVPGFAYLSNNVWAVPDEPGATHWMLRVSWEKMRNYAAMVEAPASAIAGMDHTAYVPGSGQPGSVTVTEYTPGHIVLNVESTFPSLLVVAESYYPGWRATIDGQPATILRANYLSQGLVMPKGKHSVEFSYEPDSFKYGALISLVGLAGLLGLAGWVVAAKRRAIHAGRQDMDGVTTV
jgi:hypothetical protein